MPLQLVIERSSIRDLRGQHFGEPRRTAAISHAMLRHMANPRLRRYLQVSMQTSLCPAQLILYELRKQRAGGAMIYREWSPGKWLHRLLGTCRSLLPYQAVVHEPY